MRVDGILMSKLQGKHLLTIQDYSAEEMSLIMKTASELKRQRHLNHTSSILTGRSLGMIFQKASTRTRVSFEVAMYQLGGQAIYLNWNDLQLGRGESIADTSRVLSRYVDGVMARLYKHQDLLELAKYSDIPIINGLTELYHPCQAFADLLTIQEIKGQLKGITLAYFGDGNNVCHSLMIGGTKLGMNIQVGAPANYQPKKAIIQQAEMNAEVSNGRVIVTESASEAATNADVIYTDTFVSMGQENEKAKKLDSLTSYQVNESLVAFAKDDYIFMHCLPAYRGVEVTEKIIEDASHSVVWDQAENRLHAQKALLALLIRSNS